jgi:hypothetical protein
MPTNRQLSRIFPIFSLLLCLSFITACSNAKQDIPLERVSLSKYACVRYSSDNVPHLRFETPALAGGTVRSGDFLISLWLICDPRDASDDPDFPWQERTEVRYMSFLYNWEYLGPPLDQEAKESLTFNGEIIDTHRIAPERNLARGSSSTSYRSINTKEQIVARAIAAGEPVDIILTISGSETLAEVHLRALFEETPDGYRLLSATIQKNTELP